MRLSPMGLEFSFDSFPLGTDDLVPALDNILVRDWMVDIQPQKEETYI